MSCTIRDLDRSEMEENGRRINIYCYGDSLTAGYLNYYGDYHPYTTKLLELLSNEFPNHKFKITEAGVSGETTYELKNRLTPSLQYFRDMKNKRFDFVIILGGTNDLGAASEEEIFNNLKCMYSLCAKEYSMKVVGITIPESAFGHLEQIVSKRVAVNSKIREYFSPENNNDQVCFVDIEKHLPYSKDSGLWIDALHFNAKGYDQMGVHIFDVLKRLI